MKMIPRELGERSTTTSEHRVFDALEKSGLSGTALHSLNLPEHEYKLTAELDFLLVVDELILVIEVKGAGVSCHDGLWTYSDRSGHHRQDREGPFQQASSGMYSLRDRLRKRLGARVNDVGFGFLVVTPDVDLPPSSFAWEDATYCGRGQFRRDFRAAVQRAMKHWRRRQPEKLPIDTRLYSELLRELRPDFDKTPLLDAHANRLDQSYARLTDEQFDRLDVISDAPRVLCRGGAGTGKTFLGVEIARREALSGKSVLFACRSKFLATFVAGLLAPSDVTVCSTSNLPANKKFDVLVLDEAQDVMNFDDLGMIERSLRGGWDDGRWVMLLDPNRQTHLHGGWVSDAFDFVQSLNPVPANLKVNCRNTREISFHTRALTGADTGVAAAGSGPEVQFVSIDDEKSETAALEGHLRHLRQEEVAMNAVTIVSLRGDWESSAARDLKAVRKGAIQRLEHADIRHWPGEQLTWSSVLDIKGLENRFVCVIDIDSLDSEEDIDGLYVAMSRPRAGLWVASRPSVSSQIADLYQKNVSTALEALKGASL